MEAELVVVLGYYVREGPLVYPTTYIPVGDHNKVGCVDSHGVDAHVMGCWLLLQEIS